MNLGSPGFKAVGLISSPGGGGDANEGASSGSESAALVRSGAVEFAAGFPGVEPCPPNVREPAARSRVASMNNFGWRRRSATPRARDLGEWRLTKSGRAMFGGWAAAIDLEDDEAA